MSSQGPKQRYLAPTQPDFRLAVVVLNYCTPELALAAAKSAAEDVDPARDVVLIVDNGSPDGSADVIQKGVEELGLSHLRLVRSPRNGGFAAGNNRGIREVSAEAYVLQNSDAIVRPGTMETLYRALRSDEDIGIVSPQLCGEDDVPQISCFRHLTPGSELIRGASTGVITRLLDRYNVPLGVQTARVDVPWTSFAFVMISRRVLETVGLLDEGYFMYYEDADYCRLIAEAGFRVVHEPQGRVVHLRGKSSPVKEATRRKKPRPSYFYEARSRYFARSLGKWGPLFANISWTFGVLLVLPRQLIGQKERTMVEGEFFDNWRGRRKTKENTE